MGAKTSHPFWMFFPPFDKYRIPDNILYHPCEVWATRGMLTKYYMWSLYLRSVPLQFLCLLLRVSLAFHALTHIVLIFHLHLACISSLQLVGSLHI
jgi:hypothetical protein